MADKRPSASLAEYKQVRSATKKMGAMSGSDVSQMKGNNMAGYKGKLSDGYGTGGTRKGAAGSRTSKEDMQRAGAGMAKGARKMNRAGSGARGVRKDPKGGVPGGGLGSYRK